MSKFVVKDATKESSSAIHGQKKNYQSPILVVFGEVSHLTKSIKEPGAVTDGGFYTCSEDGAKCPSSAS